MHKAVGFKNNWDKNNRISPKLTIVSRYRNF